MEMVLDIIIRLNKFKKINTNKTLTPYKTLTKILNFDWTMG